MKHFIYFNPAVCKKFFAFDPKRVRVPVSNNLLWTLFIGMGDEKFALIKAALRGRTPIQALSLASSKWMSNHADDYHVMKHKCCAISLGYFFEYLGLPKFNTITINLMYIISYDD